MSVLTATARKLWEPLAERAGRTYVAGSDLDDALRVCGELDARGIASATCYWNLPDDPPRAVADVSLRAIDAFATAPTDRYVALKAPALGFDGGLIDELAGRAADRDVAVLFDAHAEDAADRTLALAEAAHAAGARAGVALPGRWTRSDADAERMAGAGLRIRIVKGEWKAEDGGGRDAREGFVSVARRLSGCAGHVAVATHDAELARRALETLLAAGTSCELEQLVGLPVARPAAVAAELGVPVRLYVPFGYVWPMALSHVRHDPQQVWHVARRAVARGGREAVLRDALRVAGRPADTIARETA